MKRIEIDELTKRATPLEWAYYCIASTVIRLFNQSNTRIAEEIRSAAYINDRLPLRAKFIDTSKLKIGRQTIKNRIGNIFASISFDWIGQQSNDIIRRSLKREFFKHS
jgi:hypothetical protein